MNELQQQEEERESQRIRTRSTPYSPVTRLHRKQTWLSSLTTTNFTVRRKTGRSRGRGIVLSEYAKDTIKLQFHTILSKREYSTLIKLSRCLKSNYPDFSVVSNTTLRRHMIHLGFVYRKTSNLKIPLNDISYIAVPSKYFRKLHEFRADNAMICYQLETWNNAGDKRRSIWLTEDGSGSLKKSDTKDRRVAVNGIISKFGFHLDVFTCDAGHTMEGSRFVNRMTETYSKLRKKYGNKTRLCIVIDNATWQNQQMHDSRAPTPSSRKEAIEK